MSEAGAVCQTAVRGLGQAVLHALGQCDKACTERTGAVRMLTRHLPLMQALGEMHAQPDKAGSGLHSLAAPVHTRCKERGWWWVPRQIRWLAPLVLSSNRQQSGSNPSWLVTWQVLLVGSLTTRHTGSAAVQRGSMPSPSVSSTQGCRVRGPKKDGAVS